MQRYRRKARIKSGYVEAVSIAVLRLRDGDTCRICGKPVDAEREPPHPLSATIDHVIALAMGGEHSYRNTQLVHHRCNTEKGSSEDRRTSDNALPL
jgi:5-methylcytosine-specific restriction endonuclease McrA